MMNEPIPFVARCKIKGITLEFCYGEISDAFRLFWFGPTTEFELPDKRERDEDFHNWLGGYRRSTPMEAQSLLKRTQCN